MFRRYRFGGMVAPLVVGGLFFAFAKHAHRRAHMMMRCAEAQAGGDKPFDKVRHHGHRPEAFGPKWRHIRHTRRWWCEESPDQAAEQAATDADDGKVSA